MSRESKPLILDEGAGSPQVSKVWLHAAVLGGLWASFEIIVGSLLHNLHIPFSGSIMAFFSVVLMVSFLQVWKIRGFIWRAGLIAGLMKSLSPSAVILGPMTGIMMEALILEGVVLLMGRNLASYMVAGMGAMLSAVLHKLISLFIRFGTDLVRIYSNMFQFLRRQFDLEQLDGRELVILLLAAYMFLGLLASLSGFLLGRYALKNPKPDTETSFPEARGKAGWNQVLSEARFHTGWLVTHLLLLPVLLLLMNIYGMKPVAIIPVALYTLFLWFRYPRTSMRLAKPVFWIQLILLVLAAGLFWEAPGESARLQTGLLVGIEMAIRAVLVVSLFSAISVELRNPVVVDRLLGIGLGNFYHALNLAFRSLPVMLERSPGFRRLVLEPAKSMASLIGEAKAWLHQYSQEARR